MTETSYDNGAVQMPSSIVCSSFTNDGRRLARSSWLVPHVFGHYAEREVVHWRCSWGHMCEADCFHAMLRPSRESRTTSVSHHAGILSPILTQDSP